MVAGAGWDCRTPDTCQQLLPPPRSSLPCGWAEPLLECVHICGLQLLDGAGIGVNFSCFQLSLPPLNRRASVLPLALWSLVSLGVSPVSGVLRAAGRTPAQDARVSPSWDEAALLSFCSCTTKRHNLRGSNVAGKPAGTPGMCFLFWPGVTNPQNK